MSDTNQDSPETPADSGDAVSRRLEQITRERMTRREALAKVGIRTGMAIFAALNVDQLARMASKQMERHASGNRIADKLAREFKNAGVAFADESSSSSDWKLCNACCSGCKAAPGRDCIPCSCLGFTGCSQPGFACSGANCQDCCTTKFNACNESGEKADICQKYNVGCMRGCAGS